jgi:hypothetical protein
MSGKGIMIALGTVLIAAAPAASKTNAGQEELKAAAQAAPAAKDKKYCIKDQYTGTRMKAQVCRTKDEWARAGVDITAK